MKNLLVLWLLFITFSAQSQTIQNWGKSLNETVQDSRQAIKKQVTDSLENVTDSVALKYTKEEILNIAEDTIKSLAETRLKAQYGHAIENPFVPTGSDGSVVKQIDSVAKQTVKDTISNYMEVLTLDSTIADQIKHKAKSRTETALKRKTKTEIPVVTIDSTLHEQVKSEAEDKARAAIEDQVEMEIPDDIAIDSSTITNLKKEVVKQSENALKETEALKSLNGLQENPEIEIKKLKDYQDKLEQSQEKLKQAAVQQKIKQKMASQAKQYITAHADRIQEAQSQMTALKQKYSNLPNSNDLSSAVRRTSLKGKPIWKRLVVGGNFSIARTNPLFLDLSPVLGYKINKLFEMGVTGTFRKKIKTSNAVNLKDNDAFGFGVFANHALYRNFFGYIEGERMMIKAPKTSSINFNDENMDRKWEQALLIGIGRNFKIARWLEMQALMLLNVLHDNQDHLYNSPVVFKTGVRLKLP